MNLKDTLLGTVPEDVEFKPNGLIGHEPRTDAVFRPDGRAVAYPARRGEKAFVMFGDSKGPDLDKVFAPVFSRDSRTWAYWASTGNEMYIHTGSRMLGLGEGYQWLSLPVLSPEGDRIAFTAGTRDKRVVVFGGQKLGEKFATVHGDPVFSPDGSKIAYVAVTIPKDAGAGREIVVLGNEPLPGTDPGFEQARDIVFSPDGTRIAFVGVKDLPLSREFVVCDGKQGSVYGRVAKPVFSPDGKQLAYVAYKGGRWIVVGGDSRGEDYDLAGGLTFSEDGKELAFWARKGFDGPTFVVRGAWKSQGYPSVIWGPRCSPDGSRVVFAVGRRVGQKWKESVVVDDRKSEEFDEVWAPRFSPDGKRILFGARIGRELWWKVLDVGE